MHEIHEECGVFGIYAPTTKNLGYTVFCGLTALQHRGQEAAGIAVNRDRTIHHYKHQGTVHEVFTDGQLEKLGSGEIAVGHVRYSTSGESSSMNAQPMVVRHVKGQLALCHNGNLTNFYELRRKLEMMGCIFQTTSDTEVISYITIQKRLHCGSIEEAVSQAMDELEGAFSLVLMSPAKLIACRDIRGLRPLCYGMTQDGCHVVASETCALDAVGARYIRDLEPGEILVIDKHGVHSLREHCGKATPKLCVFEYIYFARSDSVIEGVSVHESRLRAGKFLAQEHPVDADMVIGVPDSGLDAAIGYSRESGIPYGMGLIKNKYIGRTFIAPDQETRESLVRLKLNAIGPAVEGKRIVMIDDSIVRGTTSAYIVGLLRKAGAREVHMRISAPPFLYPCYYGTDVDSTRNLIAVSHTPEEIAEIIGADSVGFLSVEHALQLAGDKDPNTFCAACFNGEYPAGKPRNPGFHK